MKKTFHFSFYSRVSHVIPSRKTKTPEFKEKKAGETTTPEKNDVFSLFWDFYFFALVKGKEM